MTSVTKSRGDGGEQVAEPLGGALAQGRVGVGAGVGNGYLEIVAVLGPNPDGGVHGLGGIRAVLVDGFRELVGYLLGAEAVGRLVGGGSTPSSVVKEAETAPSPSPRVTV